MVSYAFNNRFSQFPASDIRFDEFFSRDDGLTLPNRFSRQISNYQRDIEIIAERFVSAQQHRINMAVITCLSLHLNYLDQPVNCELVKPFLPLQADNKLKITVQTPITIHITECPDCQCDIETLKLLNLERKQLVGLGEMFSRGNHRNYKNCRKVREAIPSLAVMDFSSTTAETLRHICTCPRCRRLLYKERNVIYQGLLADNTLEPFPCELVSPTDMLIYVVPYSFDPANDQYARFRPSLISHLVKCPKCLGKMLKMHNFIYGILERPDSGIVTCSGLNEA